MLPLTCDLVKAAGAEVQTAADVVIRMVRCWSMLRGRGQIAELIVLAACAPLVTVFHIMAHRS